MLVDGVLLLVGLVALTVGGSLVVSGASGLGTRIGMSPTVVGLTIVAAGTSAPELAVTSQAVLSGDTGIAVGGVIGSNIANILLVLGIAALMGGIVISSRVVRTDVPLMIGVSFLFLGMSLDGELGHLDGAILSVLLVAFIWWTVRTGSATDSDGGTGEVDPEVADLAAEVGEAAQMSTARLLAMLVGGLATLVVSSRVVVSAAESLAIGLGVPDLVVGLTVVALGTSAPEVVTTVVAALRGERDLAVGNAVGSNIFNILLVLGVPSLFAKIEVTDAARSLDLPIMVAVAVACLPIVAWNHRLDRWEGGVFVTYYAAYLLYLVLDAADHDATGSFATVMVVFVVPLTVVTMATVAWQSRHRDVDREPSAPG